MDVGRAHLRPAHSDDPGWFVFTTMLDDVPFEVEVSARVETTSTAAARRAESLFERIAADPSSSTEQCAADLLEDYNAEWQVGPTLDEAAFRSRLTLKGLGLMPNSHTRVRFDDGGMFAGHDVVVDLDERLRPRYAFLE